MENETNRKKRGPGQRFGRRLRETTPNICSEEKVRELGVRSQDDFSISQGCLDEKVVFAPPLHKSTNRPPVEIVNFRCESNQ